MLAYHYQSVVISHEICHDPDFEDLLALFAMYRMRIYLYVPSIWEQEEIDTGDSYVEMLYGESAFRSYCQGCKKKRVLLVNAEYAPHDTLWIGTNTKYPRVSDYVDTKYQYDKAMLRIANGMILSGFLIIAISMLFSIDILVLFACIVIFISFFLPFLFGVKGSGSILLGFLDAIF